MDEYLTIFEVVEMTKYTVGTLRKFVLKRRIAFHKWGGCCGSGGVKLNSG
jgi:hypothetical protein